ncbi:hypothetical protein K435DRAFT_812483 [Dendrothele bispora CBS 962.96]|uniref:Mid2 domain-containing protein n=1 Tax=Dendrothele bispora (strain CBS 962.96) TaxID=1314807 RepID=A0A4S8KP93_DENBC|nr:hypothetical protein K435DRAFT_812483 [Dendrothele bispora CBS 962.96]
MVIRKTIRKLHSAKNQVHFHKPKKAEEDRIKKTFKNDHASDGGVKPGERFEGFMMKKDTESLNRTSNSFFSSLDGTIHSSLLAQAFDVSLPDPILSPSTVTVTWTRTSSDPSVWYLQVTQFFESGPPFDHSPISIQMPQDMQGTSLIIFADPGSVQVRARSLMDDKVFWAVNKTVLGSSTVISSPVPVQSGSNFPTQSDSAGSSDQNGTPQDAVQQSESSSRNIASPMSGGSELEPVTSPPGSNQNLTATVSTSTVGSDFTSNPSSPASDDPGDGSRDGNSNGNNSQSSNKDHNHIPKGMIAGIAAGGATLLAVILSLLALFCHRRQAKARNQDDGRSEFVRLKDENLQSPVPGVKTNPNTPILSGPGLSPRSIHNLKTRITSVLGRIFHRSLQLSSVEVPTPFLAISSTSIAEGEKRWPRSADTSLPTSITDLTQSPIESRVPLSDITGHAGSRSSDESELSCEAHLIGIAKIKQKYKANMGDISVDEVHRNESSALGQRTFPLKRATNERLGQSRNDGETMSSERRPETLQISSDMSDAPPPYV